MNVARLSASHRNALLIGLKVALPTLLLWLVLRKLDFAKLLAIASQVNAFAIVCALLLITLQNLLAAFRWWYILRRMNVRIRPGDALRFLYVSVFVNQVLPSSVGGDAVRMILAIRGGISTGNALKSVFLDRVLTMMGLLVLIFLGLLGGRGGDTVTGIWIVVAGLAAVAFGLGVMQFIYIRTPWFGRHPMLGRLAALSNQLRAFALNWQNVVVTIAVSVVSFFAMTLIVYTFAANLALPLPLGQLLAVCPVIFLLSAIPISIAGWGVREASMLVALGSLGVDAESALVLSLGLGLTILAGSLPAVLFLPEALGVGKTDVAEPVASAASGKRTEESGLTDRPHAF
jgi:glycosyltransferase 2 family protein